MFNEAKVFDNLNFNLVDTSPDDTPMVGPLKQYPNVYINGGHGFR